MNKHVLATFLILNAIPFFAIAQIQPSYTNSRTGKQSNKTQLLQHLKNVKVTLQKHLKWMDDNWQAASMYSDEEEDDDGELAEMIFGLTLSEDFYRSSTILQQKVSELVTPTFHFICNNIKPLTIDEISNHLLPYTKSKFNNDTIKQLQTAFQPLYTKHYKILRNSNPHIEFTQTPVDELFEQCLQLLIGTNSLFIYETEVLLQKVDAKIKELSIS